MNTNRHTPVRVSAAEIASRSIAYKSDALFELCKALGVDAIKPSILADAQRSVYPTPVVGYLSPDEILSYRTQSHDLYPESITPLAAQVAALVMARRNQQLPMP